MLSTLVLATILFSPVTYALDPARSLTQYLHRIWQMQQGLPEATIYSIAQTSDGYLWLGTQTGLVRFDGVRFEPIREVGGVSLEKMWIRQLLADDSHGLWMATDGFGILHMRDGALTRYNTTTGLPSDSIRCILADQHGTLWAGTDAGLVTLVDGKVIRYGTQQGLNLQNIRAICQSPDGTVWVGGDGPQLAAWNGKIFIAHPLTSLPPSVTIQSMVSSPDGAALWIGTSNGLIRSKDKTERRFGTADGLADDSILCLSQSNDGSLYAGTKNGFSRVRNDGIETFRPQDGLSQSTVHTLFQDHEESLWIGTKHGLNQFLDRRTIPFTESEGLPSNDTGPVLQDEAGNMWVGTIGAGLSRFDGHHFSVLTTNQGLASNTITTLAGDRDGSLWIGTDHGLNQLKDGMVERTFTTSQGLPSNVIRCLLRDKRGELWAGTDAGLARFNEGRFVQPQNADGPLKATVLAIGELPDNSIIVATAGGSLYTCLDDHLRAFPQDGLPAREIDAFFLDAEGLLWMGTRGGALRVWDGKTTFAYSVKDGLYDDDIFGIVADSQNNLWMACSKGIFSVSRGDLRKFAAGAIKNFTCRPFSPTEALRTIECKSGVQPAAYRMREGRVWFSTIHGAIVMDPEHLFRKQLPVPVLIEDVIVNGDARSPTQISKLAPGLSNLEFRYTALTFLVPTRLTFNYMLEGFDKYWVDAGSRREAFYTNLPPGNYRFRVKALNFDGTWSESSSPVAFILAPHFYQTLWFYPVAALILAWIVWGLYRLRVTRIREQLHAVLTERSRIARELHDTLMQGFSGITMEMQALSARLPQTPERSALNEIIGDAGTCLREARQSIAGLRTTPEQGSGLAASIANAARQMTEARDVRLKLKLGQSPLNLPPNVEYNLLRIAQESVANSVKHSGARTIEVALNSTPQQLIISVRDDGSGMKYTNGNGANPGHYGLIGMKERAVQIGAQLQIESEIGRGTTVLVTLPATHAKPNEGQTL
jgi:ligand-binding sensor domain-containing protein/signal transduction histidine kinase